VNADIEKCQSTAADTLAVNSPKGVANNVPAL
jgi:hypothetical protein